MPKILITESTQVNYGDDRGGQHVDSSEIVEVTKDQALKLCQINRALFVSKSDDPTKDGRYTASKEVLDAARAFAAAKAREAKAAAAAAAAAAAQVNAGGNGGNGGEQS